MLFFENDIEGILIYEMLCGFPPFSDQNPFAIYEKILSGRIDYPKHLDGVAKDLIKKLLTHDRTRRLGNMKVGVPCSGVLGTSSIHP